MSENTGCSKCDAEQEIKGDRTSMCEQHRLEELQEMVRIATSDFHFAILKKLIELDVRIEELRK